MDIKNQINEMLGIQETLNCKIHPEWRAQNFPWYRAIWHECAELLDHTEWKWWKSQEANARQIHLELVDIWHFGLSWVLQTDNAAMRLFLTDRAKAKAHPGNYVFKDPIVALEEFTGAVLKHREFIIPSFFHLKNACNLSFDGLYKMYIGKSVLNTFRQDHGYKEGTYKKNWGGREDNDVMLDISETLDASTFFNLDLKRKLTEAYALV